MGLECRPGVYRQNAATRDLTQPRGGIKHSPDFGAAGSNACSPISPRLSR
jgi:hypothetical protein